MLAILTYAAQPAAEPADRDPGLLTLAFVALRRAMAGLGKPHYAARPPVPFAWL